MVAAFGLPEEPEPGKLVIAPENVRGIHVTKLRADGSGKADVERDKIMLGSSSGWPIVLAAVNDIGGLLIAEGIENALATHIGTGLGAWSAGSAGRLPRLADKVPSYVEAVTIIADTDDSGAGLRYSQELGQELMRRGFDVLIEGGTNGRHG